jgi:hypothetical protein
MLDKLDPVSLLHRLVPVGREDIPWSLMALALVLVQLYEPSSELHSAELYAATSLLGMPRNCGRPTSN